MRRLRRLCGRRQRAAPGRAPERRRRCARGSSRRGIEIPDGHALRRRPARHGFRRGHAVRRRTLPDSHRADTRPAARGARHQAGAPRPDRTRRATFRAGRRQRLRGAGATGPSCGPNGAWPGAAAFIAAPRARTAGRDLGGRVFLHDYDWRQDDEAATLELILSAPGRRRQLDRAAIPRLDASRPRCSARATSSCTTWSAAIGVLEGNGGAPARRPALAIGA